MARPLFELRTGESLNDSSGGVCLRLGALGTESVAARRHKMLKSRILWFLNSTQRHRGAKTQGWARFGSRSRVGASDQLRRLHCVRPDSRNGGNRSADSLVRAPWLASSCDSTARSTSVPRRASLDGPGFAAAYFAGPACVRISHRLRLAVAVF